jgi:chitin disaccharide deacetylase
MPTSDAPLLIVNADDFGYDRSATDLTIECFERGQISSATAMVHMADSRNAAERARESGLPTGLHINFTEEFTAGDIPAAVKERQARACEAIGAHIDRRRWIFDPRAQRLVESAVRDQFEQYESLFGGPPSHVDGHNHVHVCPNVALARTITIDKRRNALWSWPSVRTLGARARLLRRYLTSPRAITTRYFFDISRLPTEDGGELRRHLSPALTSSLEVMAHPRFPHEREALQGRAWEDTLATLRVGSYLDLG